MSTSDIHIIRASKFSNDAELFEQINNLDWWEECDSVGNDHGVGAVQTYVNQPDRA